MYNWIYQNEFKQGALVHFEELLVPYRNVICPLLFVLVILWRWRVIFVMSAPLNHLMEKHTHNILTKVMHISSHNKSNIYAMYQCCISKCLFHVLI